MNEIMEEEGKCVGQCQCQCRCRYAVTSYLSPENDTEGYEFPPDLLFCPYFLVYIVFIYSSHIKKNRINSHFGPSECQIVSLWSLTDINWSLCSSTISR